MPVEADEYGDLAVTVRQPTMRVERAEHGVRFSVGGSNVIVSDHEELLYIALLAVGRAGASEHTLQALIDIRLAIDELTAERTP